MTETQVRDALHAVANATDAPLVDEVAFRRLVHRERRHRLASRAALAVGAVAATAAVLATTVVPFVRDGGAAPAPASPSSSPVPVDLQGPVLLVLDHRLVALDPQGMVHELGVRAEEVIGSTSERAYVVGPESGVVAFDISHSDEGPGGWRFEPAGAVVDGPVQSAQLSADGRWLGWIDLDDVLHVRDLKARTSTERQVSAGSYLVDIAQGTGAALVAEDVDLVLYADAGPVDVPTQEFSGVWGSTATRDRVAVLERQGTTRIYDVSSGSARSVAVVPGAGRLSPYGDLVASVSADPGDASSTAWVTVPGEEPRRLDVGGRPSEVAWADDDTVLVSAGSADGTAVYACEVTVTTRPCARLDVGTPGTVTFAR